MVLTIGLSSFFKAQLKGLYVGEESAKEWLRLLRGILETDGASTGLGDGDGRSTSIGSGEDGTNGGVEGGTEEDGGGVRGDGGDGGDGS